MRKFMEEHAKFEQGIREWRAEADALTKKHGHAYMVKEKLQRIQESYESLKLENFAFHTIFPI